MYCRAYSGVHIYKVKVRNVRTRPCTVRKIRNSFREGNGRRHPKDRRLRSWAFGTEDPRSLGVNTHQDLAKWLSRNDTTTFNINYQSFPVELLLICVQCQFRIPVVTQISGLSLSYRFCVTKGMIFSLKCNELKR